MSAPGKWRNTFTRSEFARNVLTLTGGSAAGQFLLLLAAPVITRLYMPDELGLLGVYLSIAAIAVVFVSLRYDWAIPVPKKDKDAVNLLALSIVVAVVVSTGTALMLLVLQGPLSTWVESDLRDLLWLLPLGLLGEGTYQALSYWSVRRGTFKLLARTRITRNAGLAFTQVALGAAGAGSMGLVVGEVTGRGLGSGGLAAFSWKTDKHLLRSITPSQMRRMASTYRRFPLYTVWSSLLGALIFSMPILFITSIYGADTGGQYLLAYRAIGVPLTLVSASFMQVFWGRMAKMRYDDPGNLKPTLFSVSRKLLLATVPLALVAMAAPWLFGVVFGSQWVQAGRFAQFLAPALALGAVATSTGNLTTFGFNHWQLLWDAARSVAVVGVFLLAGSLEWSPEVAVLVLSATLLASYLALFWLNVTATARVGASGKPDA